jgi:hypothetical protein
MSGVVTGAKFAPLVGGGKAGLVGAVPNVGLVVGTYPLRASAVEATGPAGGGEVA